MRTDSRLRNPRDFHRVRTTGSSARRDGITVWVAPSEVPGPARLGLAVKAAGGVRRNRLRRRLREAWQAVAPESGVDVVIGAGEEIESLKFQEVVEHLHQALTGAGAPR